MQGRDPGPTALRVPMPLWALLASSQIHMRLRNRALTDPENVARQFPPDARHGRHSLDQTVRRQRRTPPWPISPPPFSKSYVGPFSCARIAVIAQKAAARRKRMTGQTFACLVINLDGSADRLRSVSTALEKAGIVFRRMPAVDGRNLDLDSLPDYDANEALRYMGRRLAGGEIGCYRSHLDAARTFLATDAPYCLVLEDDAAPTPALRRIVEDATAFLDRSGPEWRIINLGNHRMKISTPCHIIEADGTTFRLDRAFYFPMTTGAIVWSRRGANEFVRGHDRIFAPVDNFLRYWITRAGGGYAFHPRPVRTSEAESVINDPAKEHRSRNGRHVLYGWRKQRRLMIDKAIAIYHQRRSELSRPEAKG